MTLIRFFIAGLRAFMKGSDRKRGRLEIKRLAPTATAAFPKWNNSTGSRYHLLGSLSQPMPLRLMKIPESTRNFKKVLRL